MFRGENIQVWGRVTCQGEGAGGLKIMVYLSVDGKASDALLGATVSGPDGRFSTGLPVPTTLKVGQYRVYGATPGDDRRAACISR